MSIIRGNAIDLIETVPLRSLDLIVTDPPYAFGGSGDEHAISAAVAVTLREAAMRLKQGCWMLVMCASSWRSISYMVESVRGICAPVRIGMWHKPVAKTKVKTPGWQWSSVAVVAMRRGPKNAEGLEPADTLDYIVKSPVMNGRRAQLPSEVADWLVSPFAITGGAFLDPFAGSGVLVEAATRNGMLATGFEVQDK